MLAMLTRARRAHIGVRSGGGDRTLLRSVDPEIAATVAPVTEPAGVASGVLSLRFRQRPWQLVVIDLLLAAWITLLTVNATLYTALGLTSGTVVEVWLLAVAVALYTVALSLRPRRSAIAAIAAVLGVTLAAVLAAIVLDPHYLLVAPNTKSF